MIANIGTASADEKANEYVLLEVMNARTLYSFAADAAQLKGDAQSGQERATLEVDSIVRGLWFSTDGCQLHTDRGVLDIFTDSAYSSGQPSALSLPSPSLFVSDQWIVY
jgi:hypothetical protein